MIKYLIMDVDGTLTDGKIYMSSEGEMMKAFNIKDGYGIHDILPAYKIEPVVITGRESRIVENRCQEIGIEELFQGVEDKMKILIDTFGDLSSIAYIGDDMNDFDCMEKIKKAGGVIGCPADATDSIKKISDYIAPHNGGCGAVRDFIEWITKSK